MRSMIFSATAGLYLAAFKTFVEQFDPEVGDFLTRALGDLFSLFRRARTQYRELWWAEPCPSSPLLVARRFPPLLRE